MYRNYFYLNRSVLELNELFDGYSIRSIYSQEKDKLILECAKDFEKRFYFEVCVNPGYPYLTIKEDYRRARKNVTDLFPASIGAALLSAEIALSDRVIKINTSNGSFYFIIRGKHTNFLSVSKDEVILFKHSSEIPALELISGLESLEYTSAFNLPSIRINDDISDYPAEIRKIYPFISKEVLAETAGRAADDRSNYLTVLNNVILEFAQKRPALFLDNTNKDVHLAPETFHIFPFDEIHPFDSFFPALNAFLSKKFFLHNLGDKEKLVSRHIEKELNKITSKIEKLKGRIEKGSREEEYKRTADLLMMNRHLISKGLQAIEVQNIYSDGDKMIIRLDPALSPQKNIDTYYDKVKSERLNYEKSMQLYKNTEKQFSRFRSIKDRFEKYTTKEELEAIMKELKIKSNIQSSEKEDPGSKFKQYIIDGKYRIYVGKDSQNNDLLTTKFARQNDYWFHARSVSGSHVVLRYESSKDPVPKNILKKAASLAAYHSKAKTAGTVPVSYTLKKYVVKKKGMEPGKVALLKEDVLLVSPEIPEGAEYVTNE